MKGRPKRRIKKSKLQHKIEKWRKGGREEDGFGERGEEVDKRKVKGTCKDY